MSRPLHPICIKCECEYKPKKSGVYVELMAKWGSYEVFMADLLECPRCGHQVISGYGDRPAGAHFTDDYKTFLKSIGKTHKCY